MGKFETNIGAAYNSRYVCGLSSRRSAPTPYWSTLNTFRTQWSPCSRLCVHLVYFNMVLTNWVVIYPGMIALFWKQMEPKGQGFDYASHPPIFRRTICLQYF